MKLILPITTILLVTAGCSKSDPAATASAPPDSLQQKLQAMTPAERTEYAKTHLDEFSAGAHASIPNTNK